MFGWGSMINGELGLGGIEDEHINTPRILDWHGAENVVSAALGDQHTLLLSDEGKIYSCGNNDYGQLGHDLPRKRPQPVSHLDAHKISVVSCGRVHSIALNKWGQVFSWGSDAHGQLAQNLGEVIQPYPKIIKALAIHHIVQIACGRHHCLALTNCGELFCWGSNTYGELGIGKTSEYEPNPIPITSLNGLPIAFIACGAHHSFAVSKSGAVYSWGKNTHGQLGLNDTTNKCYPSQLRTLRSIRVKYISCGDDFSVFLTADGGVFSCGIGTSGQLGHGSMSSEILPRQVVELMGSTVTQICCGRQHTLAFVPSRGRVYSFGVGGSGQLGVRKMTNASTPQVVLGPWVSPSGTPVVSTSDSNKKNMVRRIFAGGDHSFAIVKSIERNAFEPFDCRQYEPQSQILEARYELLLQIMNVPSDKPMDQELLAYVENVFKSLSCLNGSFLKKNGSHYGCSSRHHGIEVAEAERCFSLIGKFENIRIKELIWNCLVEDIVPKLSTISYPDVESLRIYVTIPLYHEFNNPKQHTRLHKPFAAALLRLSQQPSRVVGGWWRTASADYFERLVNIFKSVVSFVLRGQKIPENKTVFYDASLVSALDTLSYLNKLNHNSEGFKVPYDTFHISDLIDYLDVRIDYVLWLSDPGSGKLFLCNYPFIFDAQAKTSLLQTDQSIQMQSAMQNAAQQAFMAMLMQPAALASITQYLVLNVSRDKIVEDTIRELSEVDPRDLKKPLKIKFCDEEAEDAGGVKKEFFLLLLRAILDPKYGMFKEYEETRAIWFSDHSFEDGDGYGLIGMICGLAIYNFIIIDIPFPLALYKKILKENITLADMKGLSPSVTKSLQTLLDYENDDLQDVFSLTFEITKDVFGEIISVPLRPNGANIPVTQENKLEYVNAYVDYVFNESVKIQFKAFYDGFMKVCDGPVLQLFHSHELMAVVVGNENYDWHALEEVADYKNGYSSSSKQIRWFWEVIHDMSLADKKKFLLFLTGSDRIPIQGMKEIKITIQKTLDDKFLPVAHTCFNLLDLPAYETKERLKYKLMQAIQQTEGFSLV